MEHIISLKNEKIQKEEWAGTFYRLFWIYVICGVGGFLIESIWCWIDFHEYTSRTSNLFFPISCIWGFGGVLLHLFTAKDQENSKPYLFVKCTVLGALFEFLCGYLGEHLLEVTFWGLFRNAASYREVHQPPVLPGVGRNRRCLGVEDLSL